MKRLLISVFISGVLSGCAEQLSEPQERHTAEVSASDTTLLSVRVCNIPDTRSSISPDETAIADLNFYAYRDGILETEVYSTTLSRILVRLTQGCTYNLYALANTGRIAAPVKEEDMMALKYGVTSISDLSSNLPMAWKSQGFTADKSTMSLDINMERLTAKLSFTLDKSALDGIEVKSIRLRQCAKKVSPFTVNAISESSETMSGDYASQSDLAAINSGGSIFFYALENCQGTLLPDNKDQWGKVPDALGEKAGLCTYLEVRCAFAEGSLLAGNVTYRFYPGNDNATNFDIRRNTDLDIALCLTGDGLKEISWKVTANVAVQDGFAQGRVDIGRHGIDNLYIGERFRYAVDIAPELYEYLDGNIGDCTLIFRPSGTADIEFSSSGYTPGDMTIYAYGTCTSEGSGTIWLLDPDGKPLTPVSGTATVKKPRLIKSFMASCSPLDVIEPISGTPNCTINGERTPLNIYLTDSDGYNLNTGYFSGFDLGLFDFKTAPDWTADYSIPDNFQIDISQGQSNSDGPGVTYYLKGTNDGSDKTANLNLCHAVRHNEVINIDINENNHGLNTGCTANLDYFPIRLTLVDNGWAKYHDTPLSLKVDNRSNMPLAIDVWQLLQTDDDWNAIGQDEVVSTVNNYYTVSRTQYITNNSYDGDRTLYGYGYKFLSERNSSGADYISDGKQIVHPLKDIDIGVRHNTVRYDKLGLKSLQHLFDVTMGGYTLSEAKLSVTDSLSDGSFKFDIIYGNDPEHPGYDDQGIWLRSNNSYITTPNYALDSYNNLSAMNLQNLMDRFDQYRPMNIKLTYDSSSAQLASCAGGNPYGIKVDAKIDVYADGYVKTYPDGTWFAAKDNYCSASEARTVTGVTIGTGQSPIDGGAIKACMDKIYANTFFDSKNQIGATNNYQHSAHPTTVTVTLSLRTNGTDKEFYPVTVTWNDSSLSYYHAQDGTTYNPTFIKTYRTFNFVRSKSRQQ